MWMTDYVREIQRQFIDVYGYPSRLDMPGVPSGVPDGEYPMAIDGRVDRVQIVEGKIRCMNIAD
jgi:hypothetical protein